jgi:ABC-type phosphate transport system substrate-binding protein
MTLSRRHSLVTFAFVVALVLSGSSERPARAQAKDGVVLVVNARNPTQRLSKAEAAKLFLGQTAFWHGVVGVKIIVRPDDSAASKQFYGKVLDMTPQAFRSHWDKLQLSGRAVAPEVIGSIDEVARKVAATPGGLAFALASETWIDLKGIKLIEVR